MGAIVSGVVAAVAASLLFFTPSLYQESRVKHSQNEMLAVMFAPFKLT